MTEIDNDIVMKLHPVITGLRLYHRHRVIGMKNIPVDGPGLIVCNHSLATYDISLLMGAIYDLRGRICRSLVDRLFFKVPFLGQVMELTGAVEGNHQNAHRLLSEGHLVTVAPGGMFEALRPSPQRYQIKWERRKGFVRLAIQTQVPIILAACPKADDLYDVYENPITQWAYQKFKVPVFAARGLGISPIPKPIKLTHYVDAPIFPPALPRTKKALENQVDKMHQIVVERMEALMARAINKSR